ncbi:hypothetical protein BCV72DRAFT_218079 [Rhizopus microsporus var. microsporus]|nr:hypothetical protein BCV72DRAFT_218079 [Rhizopus microsporus var. microsporus]
MNNRRYASPLYYFLFFLPIDYFYSIVHNTNVHAKSTGPGGYLNTFKFLTNSINKPPATMGQLAMIGLNSDEFSQLLATRFYKQIV